MSPHPEHTPTPASFAQPEEPPQVAGFEASLGQLAELVAKLESGGLGLSESIDAYERGVALLRRLHEELARAEERVSVLVRIDDEGRPVLAPHDAAESAAEQPATRRGGRSRSGRTKSLPGMDETSAE
ncbi:MAG: exodeoxyribonuclease VII small subunit, partial [Planctomycetota bacterium]